MIKIFRYLKSSIISILAIILLLFAQAYLDLELPDYTSKIVNVGISQGGIEDTSPNVLRVSEMDKILLFTDEDEYILNNYKLLDKDDLNKSDYNKYVKKYSLLEKENLYIKKDKIKDSEKLDSVMAKPIVITLYLSKDTDGVITSKMGLPEGVDVFTFLKSLPEDKSKEMVKGINKMLKDYPDTIIDSAAISYEKLEYQTVGIDTDKLQNDYIFKSGLQMLGIAFLALLDGLLIVFIGSKMAANLAKTLRRKIFKKVVGFSKSEMKEYGQSSLITRTTNDVQQVQSVIVFLLRVVFYAPIVGIGGVIKALNTNSSMTWIIGVALLAIIVVVITLFAIAMPRFTIIQKLIDKLNLVTREILSGLPVIRAFSNEKYEETRFEKANRNLTKVNIFVNRTMSFMMPIMMVIMNVVCLAIVYKGAYGVDNGTMQVGDIMAYIQYTMQIIMAFLMISMMSIMLPRANVSAKRIIDVLETDEIIKEPKNPQEFDSNKRGLVEFKNVSFRYPDADYDVITDIDFTAKPGEVTAFIGSTGSGKSTIINLIPRFYDVTSGRILIDGVDIRDINTKNLRDKIGFVPQKGILFTGTIKENIKYGNENITDKMVKKALDISQSTEFVSKLKGKENYQISQGGTNVSGGQKQRLSIARAIAKNPDILVFDDSFSALDFKTDAILRGELAKVTKNKTVLIVAQRISTIMNADKIIVLDEGNVVGMGTHEKLMKECKVYQEIALSQLSKEELENA